MKKSVQPTIATAAMLRLGRRLALARKARGFSQHEVAQMLELGVSTVVALENGKLTVAIGSFFRYLDLLGLLDQVELLLQPTEDQQLVQTAIQKLMPGASK